MESGKDKEKPVIRLAFLCPFPLSIFIFYLMPHARRAPSKHENPPLPPFSKGGLGGFRGYFLFKIDGYNILGLLTYPFCKKSRIRKLLLSYPANCKSGHRSIPPMGGTSPCPNRCVFCNMSIVRCSENE